MDYFQDLKISLFRGEKTGTIDFSQPSLFGTTLKDPNHHFVLIKL
jgi:hypothetical protein